VLGSSQNARFPAGGVAGLRIAEAIAAGLAARGFFASAPEPWRAFGYRVRCRAGEHDLEITVDTADGTLQIAPTAPMGILERVRATQNPAAAACYRVAAVVHLVLAADVRCAEVRWRWDGPARDDDAPYPLTLSSIQATIAT
jgi:hypothetical protein